MDERVKMVARAYQAFFKSLAFKALPSILHKYLGESGFVDVVEALAQATIEALPHLIDATKGLVEVPSGDVLDKLTLHMKCHTAAREILGDASVGIFNVRKVNDNRLLFEAEKCPHEESENPLLIASYIGVIVGVLRALGAQARGLRSEEAKRHLRGWRGYVVYPLGKDCTIVVEKIGD